MVQSLCLITSSRSGGLPTQPVTAEVTYGLERLASLYPRSVDSVYDAEWADGVTAKFSPSQHEHSAQLLKSVTKTCSWEPREV